VEEEKILVITKFGVEGYSLLAKLASKYNRIIWISSNSYIPSKILELYSYSGDAKLFSFYSHSGQTINPLNLNEISLAISRSGGQKIRV